MSNTAIENKLLQVTKGLEQQVDAAIERIDNLDVTDLEQLRKQRFQEMKVQQSKKKEWIQSGHGSYEQLGEEKMFFEAIKKSDNVVIHFFTPTNTRSPIVDKHLKILAPKHLETKFVALNAEKCPFLAEKLKIKIIPSLVCIQKGIMVDKVVGFTSLGNRDDFSTEVLEWRLAQNKVIEYEGDLTTPPDDQVSKPKPKIKSSIRDGVHNNQWDDDLEMEDYSDQFQGKNDLLSGNLQKDYNSKFNQNFLTPEEELELGLGDEDDK